MVPPGFIVGYASPAQGYCLACGCTWYWGHDCGTGSVQVGARGRVIANNIGFAPPPAKKAEDKEESKERQPLSVKPLRPVPKRLPGPVRPLRLARGVLPKARGDC
jgi:hypothetical protein